MLDNFDAFINFCKIPEIFGAIRYFFMFGTLLGAISLARKFVTAELTSEKKSKHADPSIIIIAGTLIAIICNEIGLKAIAFVSGREIAPHLASTMSFLVGIFAFIQSANKILSSKIKIISPAEFKSIEEKAHRLTIMIFAISASSAEFLSLAKAQSTAMTIADIISLSMLIYYFVELYRSKNVLTKCLDIKKKTDVSIGTKLVAFINNKFNFLALLAMGSVLLMNSKHIDHAQTLVLRNIFDMIATLLIMLGFQGCAIYIANAISKKIEESNDQDSLISNLESRQKSLFWINNTCIFSLYLAATISVLYFIGLDIGEHIFHDSTIVCSITVLVIVLAYHAFKELTEVMMLQSSEKDKDRMLTFLPVVSVIFNVILACISICTIFSQLGIAIVPLLASLTAVGAAFALAAQDIIKSFLQGVILVCENNFYVGDYITVNTTSGIVKKMSTRVLVLQDLCGDEHIIPYELVKQITNHSQEYYIHTEYLLLDPYSNVNRACELLLQTGKELQKDKNFKHLVFSDITISGIGSFTAEGVKIRWTLRTSSDKAGRLVNLEVYRRLFKAFKEEHIKIPYDQELAAITVEMQEQK